MGTDKATFAEDRWGSNHCAWPEVTSVTWPEVTPVTCPVRKYVLRMRNRKLRNIRPSGAFWSEVTKSRDRKRPCPEVALTVDWRYDLGEDVYITIKAPQLTIHIRKYFVPNGEWTLHPTKRGVTPSLYEWKELKKTIPLFEDKEPELRTIDNTGDWRRLNERD